MTACEVGKSYVLALIFAYVLVHYRAVALLVDMVAVDVCDTLLDNALGLGNILFGGRVPAVLVLDGEVHVPALVEGIAVVIAAVNLLVVPSLDGNHIILSLGIGE